jgi:hypothetical protein
MNDAKLDKLERRLLLIEKALETSEGKTRIELAETTFKTVLDADYHLDDKASRILSAMAFFTAAAAAIFAKAYTPSLSENELRTRIGRALSQYAIQDSSVVDGVINNLRATSVQLFGYDLSLVAFLGYMIFAVVSAGFYLAALGPSLNKPSEWLASAQKVQSRLFYDFIAQVDNTVWTQQWSQGTAPIANLQSEFERNYIFESRLLAEKARAKYLWLSFGALFLRLALLCLIVLAASLFASRIRTVQLLSMFGCALLIGVFAFQNVTKTRKPKLRNLLNPWTGFLVIGIVLLLSYCVLILTNARLAVFVAGAFLAGAVFMSLRLIAELKRRPFCEHCSLSWLMGTLLSALVGIVALVY